MTMSRIGSRASAGQPSTNVLVTGATGFLGTTVVELLARESSLRVIPTGRRSVGAGRVARFGLQVRLADLCDSGALEGILRGINVVVHCAFGGDTNQEKAMANLLAAAKRQGIHQFIHVSTTEAYQNQAGLVDETAPLQTDGRTYGAVKGRLDLMAQRAATNFDSLVVLRPAIIYGPLSDSWTVLPLARMVQAGWRAGAEGFGGTCNAVHVADVARVIRDLLTARSPGLTILNVVGQQPGSWKQYFDLLAAEIPTETTIRDGPSRSRLRVILRPLNQLLPSNVKKALARVARRAGAGAFADRWRAVFAFDLARSEQELYDRKVEYTTARLQAAGLACQIRLEQGIRQSVQWAEDVGLA